MTDSCPSRPTICMARPPLRSPVLAEAFLPPEGDRRTAVNAFLVEENGRRILIDAGSGNSLGPDTGYLSTNLAAAQTDPAEVDHVVLTHLHPDHAGGLLSPEGQPVFPRAAVHAAKADADHWLDPDRAAAATGVQRLVHDTVARALAPYRETRRFLTLVMPTRWFPACVQSISPGIPPATPATCWAKVMQRCCFGATPSIATACSCDVRP